MKKIVLGLTVLCAVALSSCNKFLTNELEETINKNEEQMLAYINAKNISMIKDENGMYYQITQTNPNGKTVKLGDEVLMHYTMTLLDGTRVDSTKRLTNEPLSVIFGATIGFQGISDAVSKLKNGERGFFLIPSYLAYGMQQQGPVPGKSVIGMDIEIMKIRSEENQIEDYILNGTNTTFESTEKTASGVHVLKIKQTTGTQLASGQTATVKYTGYLANSIKQFDTGQIDVYLGGGSVVKGFDEGLQRLKVGEKAVLVFPSSLGYGSEGILDNTTRLYKIPPYAPLIFVVEIVSVR